MNHKKTDFYTDYHCLGIVSDPAEICQPFLNAEGKCRRSPYIPQRCHAARKLL